MTYTHVQSDFRPRRISELLEQAPPDANTREGLAKLIGVSTETINQMEQEGFEPTLNMAYKLAAAFQIPLENLFTDNPEITTDAPGKAY